MSVTPNISTCWTSTYAKNSSECHDLPYHFTIFSFSTNLILGVPAHGYILWLSMKEMIRGQSLEVFIFNTSLMEVIFNFSFPFVIKHNCSNCKSITLGFVLFLLVGRPLFQAFTFVEQYVAVLHPVTFLKFKPMKYRIAISVVGWVLIISFCIIVTLGIIDMYDFLLPEYFTFLITKVFTCLMVLKALKRPGPGEDVKQRERVNRDKVKAFRIIQIMLVSSVLTYGPITISLVLYHILDFRIFLVSWSICLCSGLMLGSVQPILYLRRVRKVHLCFGIGQKKGKKKSCCTIRT